MPNVKDIFQKAKTIWKNKWKILEGVWNNAFPSAYVKGVAAHRRSICESNDCGWYDPKGKSEKAVLKGTPSCGLCGCSLPYKTSCLSCYCALKDIYRKPLWDVRMTEKQEAEWRKKHGIPEEKH